MPLPVREQMIPKASGKVRRLGIPTAMDRCVRASLKLVFEPIFEANFKPCSYGFGPRRRPHDAIAEIHLFATQGYTWVLEGDITACFDEVHHTALMDRVRYRIGDSGSSLAAPEASPCQLGVVAVGATWRTPGGPNTKVKHCLIAEQCR